MSKEITCHIPTLNLDEVKSHLVNGTTPSIDTNLGSRRLREQLYAIRPTILANAERYTEFGYDVGHTLALCDALLVIVGETGASQAEAKAAAKKAVRDRDEARAALIAAKEAMVSLARMSGVSTKPFESEMSSDNVDPVALGQALLAAVRAHAHVLKYPALVAKVRGDVEQRLQVLVDAMKAREIHKAHSIATTEEKRLARGAIFNALQELSRLGRVIFADDKATKRALALTALASPSKKAKSIDDDATTPVEPETPIVEDSIVSPVVVEEEIVEEVVVG